MVLYTGASADQGSVMGPTDQPYFIPEQWIARVIRARARMFNLANQTMAMPFAGNKGDSLRMPYVGRLKTRRKVAGRPFMFESRKDGELKMIIDRHNYSGFAIDRKLDIQSHIALGPAYMMSIGEALAEDIEYSLLAERATFMSYDSTNNRIQSSVPISYANMLAAFSRAMELDSNPSNWTFNISPLQYTTLFNIDQFTRAVQYNSGEVANIPNGAIVGTIFGSPVVLNQSIRKNGATELNLGGYDYQDFDSDDVVLEPSPGFTASNYLPTQYGSDRWNFASGINVTCGANYHSALYLHKEAIMLGVQLSPEMTSWYSNDYGETRFLGQQLFDIKVKNPQLGIVIETDEEDLIA